MLEETRDKLLARHARAEAAKNIEDAKEDRDAKKAEGAGAAARGGGGREEGAEDAGAAGAAARGGGGREEGAEDAGAAGAAARGGGGREKGAEDAGAAGAAGSAERIACLIAAGLAPTGEWHAGRDGAPRPGRRGWRQRHLPPHAGAGGGGGGTHNARRPEEKRLQVRAGQAVQVRMLRAASAASARPAPRKGVPRAGHLAAALADAQGVRRRDQEGDGRRVL